MTYVTKKQLHTIDMKNQNRGQKQQQTNSSA